VGFGDLQDDWEVLLTDLEELDLSGKNVALFAVGNSQSNSDSFCGSMSHLYNAIKENGPKIIEGVSVEGYSFDESDSVIDGMFVGLAIDEDNESDLTESRVDNWLKKVLPNFS
jgi:flavodoxin I